MTNKNPGIKLTHNTNRRKNLSVFLYSLFLIIVLVQSLNAQPLQFPKDDGRHEEADFEAWSLFTHLETDKGQKFGVAVFFFTGEVIGITASGLYVVVADEQNKEYQNFSKIQIPLFSSTTHTVGRLMENYSDNVLERDPEGGDYKVNIDLGDFSISLKYNPLKKPVDIGQMAVGEEGFNRVYAVPRGEVSAQMLYAGKEYKLSGIGIFQHQWGDKPEQDALSDIFALHFNDTTDVLIYHSGSFTKINTMLISDRDGSSRILRKFSAKADTTLSLKSSNDKFKLDWRFKSPENQFEIKVSPGFKGQEIEMLGLSYWLSKCKVEIEKENGKTTDGVGYIYIGYDKNLP